MLSLAGHVPPSVQIGNVVLLFFDCLAAANQSGDSAPDRFCHSAPLIPCASCVRPNVTEACGQEMIACIDAHRERLGVELSARAERDSEGI